MMSFHHLAPWSSVAPEFNGEKIQLTNIIFACWGTYHAVRRQTPYLPSHTTKCEELRLSYHMTLHACVGSDNSTENRVVVQVVHESRRAN